MKFTVKHKELIDRLQELCPTAFPKKPAPKVALAHGSTQAIQKVLNVNYHTAESLLHYWCQGKRYDKACSIQGVSRYTVDGRVLGKVTAKQSEFHRDRLEKYYRNRAVGEAKYCEGSIMDYYDTKFKSKDKPMSIMGWLRDTIGVLWNTKEAR